jgi:hypothetical protein
MAAAKAAPATALVEVLRNSRRVVLFDTELSVVFIIRNSKGSAA